MDLTPSECPNNGDGVDEWNCRMALPCSRILGFGEFGWYSETGLMLREKR